MTMKPLASLVGHPSAQLGSLAEGSALVSVAIVLVEVAVLVGMLVDVASALLPLEPPDPAGGATGPQAPSSAAPMHPRTHALMPPGYTRGPAVDTEGSANHWLSEQ
jgi:hypothetical protein